MSYTEPTFAAVAQTASDAGQPPTGSAAEAALAAADPPDTAPWRSALLEPSLLSRDTTARQVDLPSIGGRWPGVLSLPNALHPAQLLDILNCSMSDLIEPVAGRRPRAGRAAGDGAAWRLVQRQRPGGSGPPRPRIVDAAGSPSEEPDRQ